MTKLDRNVWKKSLESLRADLESVRAEYIAVCMQRWNFRRRSLSWEISFDWSEIKRHRSFFAPSIEDLAWISNQGDATRVLMILHADHTCSWESRCLCKKIGCTIQPKIKNKAITVGRSIKVRLCSLSENSRNVIPGKHYCEHGHAFRWASDLAKFYRDWGPDLCESRRLAHSPIGVLRMSISTSSVVSRVDWKACA